MPKYHYEVIDVEGAVRQGEVEEENPEVLADSLQKKGLIVISINRYGETVKTKGGLAAYFEEMSNKMLLQGGVKLDTLMQFTTQLASMVGAGLHLLRTLSSLAEDMDNKAFKLMLTRIRDDVEQGEAFSSALAEFPKVFGGIYVNLVKAAEATGEMDVILNQLAVYLDKTITLRRKVKGAMTYPVVVLAFALIAVVVIMIKIVPIFEDTYTKLGADLPAATKSLIGISNIIRHYFFFSVTGVVGVIFILWRLFNTEKGKYVWDGMILKFPIFGPLMKKAILTRFLRTLSILLQSGVSVLEGFRLAGQASGNKVIERAAYHCMEDVRDGRPINESMAKTKIFPDIVIRMVASGEEAGTMPDMLQKVTVYFEQQVETAVDSLSSLIEPILIVFLGILIGSVVVAIFLPIFNLGGAIKGASKKG